MSIQTYQTVSDQRETAHSKVALDPIVIQELQTSSVVRVLHRYGVTSCAPGVVEKIYNTVCSIIYQDLRWYSDPCQWPFPQPILPLYTGLSRQKSSSEEIAHRAQEICTRPDLMELLEYRRNCYAHLYLDAVFCPQSSAEDAEIVVPTSTGEFDDEDIEEDCCEEAQEVYASPEFLEKYIQTQTARYEQVTGKRKVEEEIDRQFREYLDRSQ